MAEVHGAEAGSYREGVYCAVCGKMVGSCELARSMNWVMEPTSATEGGVVCVVACYLYARL